MRKKENLGYERTLKNGQIIKVLPDKLKRELVKKIESDQISIDDVMLEYEISYPSRIKDWLIKFGKNREQYVSNRRSHLSPQEKIKIVTEYNSEQKTIIQYCKELEINPSTFRRWENLYSCSKHKTRTVKMKPIDEKIINLIGNNSSKIIKELDDARLKIAGLETMINIAEEDLKISIKKKYGTKQ